jgi:7-cyano-7-deazaguanine reductase
MSEKTTIQDLAGKVLGIRTGEYKNYSPDVLAPVPRNLSIEYLGVKMEELPGDGFDVWYSYEFRCLTNQGLPVAAAIKFIIPHSSKNIIESKSFKLYCNSFTMEKLGETKTEALEKACEIMKKDLSKAAEGEVEVSIVTADNKKPIFNWYREITEVVDPKIEVSVYNEDPSLLQVEETDTEREYRFKFDALRSKCRLTKQPDSGSVYIYYKSKKHINEESLVRYLASFYGECHFHEEILVTIFTRLSRLLNSEDSFFCTALYQRRGSLDIGPLHYTGNLPDHEKEIINNLKVKSIFAFDPTNLFR